MTLEEFREIDRTGRANDPSLFRLAPSDRRATNDQLSKVEFALGFALPKKYRQLLQEYGGGKFGSEVIFSADETSPWFLLKQKADVERILPEGILPISTDGAGGFYVVKTYDHLAQDEIYYWYQGSGLEKTRFPDIFAYIAENAY